MTRPTFYPFKSQQAKSEYEAYCAERFKAWPPGSESRLLKTPCGQTFVRACGRTADPPLVLLHGARGGSLMWTEMIAALSAHHRAYALDTPGDAGFSVSRRDFSKPEELVNWLDEVLAVLAPQEPVSLMGISYGGFIASQYALSRPDRLRSVVLLAPGATVLKTSVAFLARMALLSVPLPGRGGDALTRMLRWVFRDAERTSDTTQALLSQVIGDVKMLQRLFSLPRPPWPPVIDDEGWRRFRVPCLFLVGENEKIYSAQAAVRRLNRVAPQVRAEIIPGAGHDLTMVQPELVLGKALAFIAEREGAPASSAA
jgi:pimeloyl-ACP methyl ester carboxylesterase